MRYLLSLRIVLRYLLGVSPNTFTACYRIASFKTSLDIASHFKTFSKAITEPEIIILIIVSCTTLEINTSRNFHNDLPSGDAFCSLPHSVTQLFIST